MKLFSILERLANAMERRNEIDRERLDFEKWKLDSGEIIMLIPLYLYSLIPEGLEVTSIFGEKIVYDGTNIDNDERLGLLAYGIMLSKGNS